MRPASALCEYAQLWIRDDSDGTGLANVRSMRLGTCLLALLLTSPALARPGDGVKPEDIAPTSEIKDTVEAGALLPWSVSARHPRQGMLIHSYGGYDSAKRAPVMMGALDATLIERITLRAVGTNEGMNDQLNPAVGLLVDVLYQENSGLDLALGGDYELEGWNRQEWLVTRMAAGRTAGLTRVQANAAFGLATNGVERYGDLRLSGLHPVAEGLYAGLDSRARVDLERAGEEPSGEMDWDMQAGPVATVAVGRWSVSATGGVSAWKLRSRETTKLGAVGALGVGAVF
jgi:hypothetical protein